MPLLVYFVFFITSLGIACLTAAWDDSLDRASLAYLEPLVESLYPIGEGLAHFTGTYLPFIALGCALYIGVALVVRLYRHHTMSLSSDIQSPNPALSSSGRPELLLVAGAVALFGQALFLARHSSWGAVAMGMAFLCALFATHHSRNPALEAQPSSGRFSWTDFGLLFALTVLAIYFRFYALNRVFDYFEGELSPYSAGATDLAGMLQANAGANGPWAPLGYTYYLPIYAMSEFFGTRLISIRLASAIVSVCTIPLIYLFTRRIAGASAAVLAAAFVTFDHLQIGWGRTDIHPHGSTVWITILLCWALVNALETLRWRYFVAVVLLMGASYHQYPSGQFAVGIPFGVCAWLLLFDRERLRRIGWSKLLLFPVGGLLWYAGGPLINYLSSGELVLPPFLTMFGARTSWADSYGKSDSLSVLWTVVLTALSNTWDLIRGVYAQVPFLFHQEWIPGVEGTPSPTVQWLAAASLVITFAAVVQRRRDARFAVLFFWIVFAALPSILSNIAYAKRASTLYPALAVAAGVALATVLEAGRVVAGRAWFRGAWAGLGAGAVCLCILSSFLWFSGKIFPHGQPEEERVARWMEQFVEPGTILVIEPWHHYLHGQFLYLLLDTLRSPSSAPVVIYFYKTYHFEFEKFLADPAHSTAEVLPRTIEYSWTKLRRDLTQVLEQDSWKRITFISQISSYSDEHRAVAERFELARKFCVGGSEQRYDSSRPVMQFSALVCPMSRWGEGR